MDTRRGAIDEDHMRYQVDTLHDLPPYELAQYLAALRLLSHQDEGVALGLLGSDAKFDRLIGLATRFQS